MVKRLFTGNVSQIIAEIIQNAARAGARRLEFTTSSNEPDGVAHKLCVRDDGTGVINGIDGWHTMLSIADSAYKDKNVSMQDCLGVGLHSLFASAQVYKVTIRSQGKMIEIDTALWWADSDYYSTWSQRLMANERETGTSGLELEIDCDSKFIESAIRSLTATEERSISWHDLPARGYEGVIEITLNNEPVDTSILARFYHRPESMLWEGDYLGNRLKIGHGPRSCINWYGQAIEECLLDGRFSFYLDVRTGAPLDLQSPTREGVIKNDKREALKRFIIDRIFETVNTLPIEAARLDWVRGLYLLDPARADSEAKYYVVERINDASGAEFSSNKEFCYVETEVKAYDQNGVLLVWRGVTVEYQKGGEHKRLLEQHGIETFVQDLKRVYGEPYELIVGSKERLSVREILWRPGNVETSIFVEAGVFTLREEGIEPQEWHAVTGEVFTFDWTAVYDMLDAKPLVAAKDGLVWLRSQSPWALFDPRDAENTFEKCVDSFDNSINDLIVREYPNMIAEPIFLSDISWRLDGSRVTAIFVTWPERGRPLLRVTNESGQETELQLI